MRGLEPPRDFSHNALNVARATISPHPQKFGAEGGIRTHTVRFLRALTLPVGLHRHITKVFELTMKKNNLCLKKL